MSEGLIDRFMAAGPVASLCREIGFTPVIRGDGEQAVLVAFVGVLIEHVADMRCLDDRIGHVTGKPPSSEGGEAIRRAKEMLALTDRAALIEAAAALHGYIHHVHPPEDGPTDHYLDMVASCASAIRFGLEEPCRSRHAAEAASHIWKRLYGISRFDRYTPAWQHDWAREQLREAICRTRIDAAIAKAKGEEG